MSYRRRTIKRKLTRKQLVEQALIDKLHEEARKIPGVLVAAIGDSGYARIHRMTQTQLEDELARLNGTKTLDELPDNHVCLVVG